MPRTEVLIVLRFLSAVIPDRAPGRRRQGVTDLGNVYEDHRDDIDRAARIELSRLVHPGAEHELGELLDKIDRGEPIAI